MSGFAWVTLATNDSYSLGALVLAHSLRQVNTAHQLAVLVTPGVTGIMREKLASVFNVVKEVNILDSRDEANLRLLQRPELGITFTKLHCWRLTQFGKCVFLDADTMVLENIDELFDREELSAAPDVGWPDCFNSGVFVYRPSEETYARLVQFAIEKGSFDGGDQGLLNLYFSDWAHKDISKHLPFIYNMCSTACYSYLPAFKQFGRNIKVIHFIGNSKPWLQYFDTESQQVQVSPDLQHLRGILQQWWNIFCTFIHPVLSSEMAGLAGAFAQLTLGVPRTAEQNLLEDHLRRQGWEVGNIDYMGRDSFENIWSKICETLASAPVPTTTDPAAPATVAATSTSSSTTKTAPTSVPSIPTVLEQPHIPESVKVPETECITKETIMHDANAVVAAKDLERMPVCSLEKAEVDKPSQSELVDISKPDTFPETVGATKPPQSSEPIKLSEPTESTVLNEPLKPTTPLKVTEPSEPTKILEATEPIEFIKPVELTKTLECSKPSKPPTAQDPIKTDDSTKPLTQLLESTKLTEPTKFSALTSDSQSIELAESLQKIATTAPPKAPSESPQTILPSQAVVETCTKTSDIPAPLEKEIPKSTAIPSPKIKDDPKIEKSDLTSGPIQEPKQPKSTKKAEPKEAVIATQVSEIDKQTKQQPQTKLASATSSSPTALQKGTTTKEKEAPSTTKVETASSGEAQGPTPPPRKTGSGSGGGNKKSGKGKK